MSKKYLLNNFGHVERFVDMFRNELLYHPTHRTWYAWDGKRFEPVEKDRPLRYAKRMVKAIADEAATENDSARRTQLFTAAEQLQHPAKLTAIITLAKDEMLAVDPNSNNPIKFDAVPDIINAANGVIDMSTGRLMPHDPKYLCSKITNVVYDPDATHPLFDKLLNTLTSSDLDYQRFLQTWFGYSSSALVKEKKFAIAVGPADSAKSTLTDSIANALGDYFQRARISSFLVRKNKVSGSNAEPDIVKLDGARMVTTSEVDEGERFAEGFLKSMSSGDKQSSRANYGNEIEFYPILKITFVVNKIPSLNTADSAILTRLILLPFNNSIPANEVDVDLRPTLMNDPHCQSAILAWLVKGYQLYLANRLVYPEVVKQEIAQTIRRADNFTQFVEECCVVHPDARVSLHKLFRDYARYCLDIAEKPLRLTEFVDRLKRIGCYPARTATTRSWAGIRMRDTSDFHSVGGGVGTDLDTNDTVSEQPSTTSQPIHPQTSSSNPDPETYSENNVISVTGVNTEIDHNTPTPVD